LANFFKSLMPQQAEQLTMFGTMESEGFSGFPIRRVTLQNGQATSTSELSELRREAIPASTWATPEGFKRQSMGIPR